MAQLLTTVLPHSVHGKHHTIFYVVIIIDNKDWNTRSLRQLIVSRKWLNSDKPNGFKLNLLMRPECHGHYHVILVPQGKSNIAGPTPYLPVAYSVCYCCMAHVDSALQDLMTFTTKAEEDRLMASSKQVHSTPEHQPLLGRGFKQFWRATPNLWKLEADA